MRFKNVKVGDYLYCSGEHRSDSRMDRERYKGLWKVLKVGRVYITLCQHEKDESTTWMHQKITKDGRADYGFYVSEEEFDERTERVELVTLIRKEFQNIWRNPKYDIPLEDLRTAVKLLKVKE